MKMKTRLPLKRSVKKKDFVVTGYVQGENKFLWEFQKTLPDGRVVKAAIDLPGFVPKEMAKMQTMLQHAATDFEKKLEEWEEVSPAATNAP